MTLSSRSILPAATLGAVVMFGLAPTTDGVAMATNSQMVLFSHVEGVVTRDGEPVAGAEIVQKVLYKADSSGTPGWPGCAGRAAGSLGRSRRVASGRLAPDGSAAAASESRGFAS